MKYRDEWEEHAPSCACEECRQAEELAQYRAEIAEDERRYKKELAAHNAGECDKDSCIICEEEEYSYMVPLHPRYTMPLMWRVQDEIDTLKHRLFYNLHGYTISELVALAKHYKNVSIITPKGKSMPLYPDDKRAGVNPPDHMSNLETTIIVDISIPFNGKRVIVYRWSFVDNRNGKRHSGISMIKGVLKNEQD